MAVNKRVIKEKVEAPVTEVTETSDVKMVSTDGQIDASKIPGSYDMTEEEKKELQSLVAPTLVGTVKTAEPIPAVTVTVPANSRPIEEKVKIKLSKNYRCHIGGTTYDFEKDKVYVVPKDVRRVLSGNPTLLKPVF